MNDQATTHINKHVMLKLVEELNELATEVIKYVNRGCHEPSNRCDRRNKRIAAEIADVNKWIERVRPIISISNDDG